MGRILDQLAMDIGRDFDTLRKRVSWTMDGFHKVATSDASVCGRPLVLQVTVHMPSN